ncbi:unnamed protein product [Owenia fusiformis]|uniref:Uncharacterized protein n=1 Tax=Owenia fusiformis TaxID=6347 RepID=A0A8J1UAF3_OWEFU|nr:unnamed protein product [Owenia fusiformis]
MMLDCRWSVHLRKLVTIAIYILMVTTQGDSQDAQKNKKKVRPKYNCVCYYTNWSQYRPAPWNFLPENVDPMLCTHIAYAFADLEGNQLKQLQWNDETMYKRINNHKKINPFLKTLLSVGGANLDLTKMTAMMSTSSNRAEFVETSIKFLRTWQFDGLDLDFEFPGAHGSPPDDKYRFSLLVADLRKGFNAEAFQFARTPLLLTAAVAAGKDTIDNGYEIEKIAPHMDFINLMSYDFNGHWSNQTGHNAPLFPTKYDFNLNRLLNVNWAANHWARNGMPRQKINVGMPGYGRTFTLKSKERLGLRSPVNGAGKAGKYTKLDGFLSYFEVCRLLMRGGSRFWSNEQRVPIAIFEDQWVGYDDPESLMLKAQWVKRNRFGGVMIWALDLDDFLGRCGNEKYPLLNTLVDTLESKATSLQHKKYLFTFIVTSLCTLFIINISHLF